MIKSKVLLIILDGQASEHFPFENMSGPYCFSDVAAAEEYVEKFIVSCIYERYLPKFFGYFAIEEDKRAAYSKSEVVAFLSKNNLHYLFDLYAQLVDKSSDKLNFKITDLPTESFVEQAKKAKNICFEGLGECVRSPIKINESALAQDVFISTEDDDDLFCITLSEAMSATKKEGDAHWGVYVDDAYYTMTLSWFNITFRKVH